VRAATAVTVVLLAVTAGCGGRGVASKDSPTSALVDMGHGLRGPAGSRAVIASTGAAHVASLAEDAIGRLWFGTADYDDTGHDGVYLSSGVTSKPLEVLAAQHTVLGLAWVGDELYVASKERVDAYSGFDGTAFASHRTVVTFEPGVGEVNQIVMGPDGRFRLGISSPCDSCTPTVPHAGSVVSFLPDGSDLRTEASAIRAPVGLAYVPGTADLLVTMNQRDDLGQRTPGDWLSHVSDGQDWRQPACYGQGAAKDEVRSGRSEANLRRSSLGPSTCAGVPAPVATLDPHAAASGVAIVGGAAIVAEWTKGKVLRIGLHHDGATYTGTAAPFVTGIPKPMAVLASANGSVLVGDWQHGTVYRIEAADRKAD
jgi:glucose/arabinose dehydrogenase